MNKVTIAEVAKHAGCSPATASLALNDHPRVSERMRLKVKAAAESLGYAPNHAARKLAKTRFGSGRRHLSQVAFVLVGGPERELITPYLGMLKGAEYELSRIGADLLFVRCSREKSRERIRSLARSGKADGWLLVGAIDDEVVAAVRASRCPWVVLAGHSCASPIHNVDADYRTAAEAAVRHLAALGHTRIAYLGSRLCYPYQRDTFDGYQAGIRALGLDPGPEMVIWDDGAVETKEKLRDLLGRDPQPTALVVSEDGGGPAILSLLRQAEIRVPEEMSVVAFAAAGSVADGTELTHMAIPYAEIGATGAAMLRELASVTTNAPARRLLLTPSLIAGKTCVSCWERNGKGGEEVRDEQNV